MSLSGSGGAGGDAKGGTLSNYLYSANSGYRAPVINFALGGSNQQPNTSATAGSTWPLIIAAAGIALVWLIKR